MVAADLDAWLRGGGLVVTASERAARALSAAFHRARRAEGLAAWPAPHIHPWNEFVRDAWQQRSLDGRLILNPAQEESLWAEIIQRHTQSAALLEGPRHRADAFMNDEGDRQDQAEAGRDDEQTFHASTLIRN